MDADQKRLHYFDDGTAMTFVRVRLSEAEWRAVRRAARAARKTVGQWCRDALNEGAREAMERASK